MKTKEELKPCPFCGMEAKFNELEQVFGTCFEYFCDCGMAGVSLQICDFMTLEERLADTFRNTRYGMQYIKRARDHAMKYWNRRTGRLNNEK